MQKSFSSFNFNSRYFHKYRMNIPKITPFENAKEFLLQKLLNITKKDTMRRNYSYTNIRKRLTENTFENRRRKSSLYRNKGNTSYTNLNNHITDFLSKSKFENSFMGIGSINGFKKVAKGIEDNKISRNPRVRNWISDKGMHNSLMNFANTKGNIETKKFKYEKSYFNFVVKAQPCSKVCKRSNVHKLKHISFANEGRIIPLVRPEITIKKVNKAFDHSFVYKNEKKTNNNILKTDFKVLIKRKSIGKKLSDNPANFYDKVKIINTLSQS